MRVVIVSTYPPDHCGIGDYTCGFCTVLSEKMVIDVVTYRLKGVSPHHEDRNLRIHRILSNHPDSETLLKAIAELDPDVVHVQTATYLHWPFLLTFAKRIRGTPIVVTAHDTPLGIRQTPWRIFHQTLFDHTSGFFVHSRRVQSELEKQYHVPSWKIMSIPLGVDCDAFKPRGSPTESGSPDAIAVKFGFFGFIAPGKGLETLLRAFALGQRRMPRSRLKIMGADRSASRGDPLRARRRPYREKLKEAARSLGISGVVDFSGFVQYDKLPQELSSVDVFVMPYEGSPTSSGVLPTLLSLGKPIICTRVRYFEDSLLPGFTTFVGRNDIPELAEAMVRTYSNPDERNRMGKQARKYAIDQVSWQAQRDSLEQAYQKLCNVTLAV